MRGKWHHHGGHICGIVVLGFTVLFVLFLLYNPTGWEFFVPARILIAVKLKLLTWSFNHKIHGGDVCVLVFS
jgi:hypothetical protein